MSLARAHIHSNIWQPVVRIDYDCGSATVTSEGKKLKGKKSNKASNLKKKYALRNRQKASNIKDKRRVSISDSGEDMPLSYLASRENVNSPSIRGAAPRKSHVVKQPDPLIRRLPASQKRRNTAPHHKTSALNSDISLSTATNTRKALDKNAKPFQEETPASQNSLPVQSCSTQESPSTLTPSRSSPVPNKSPVPPQTSPLQPHKLPSPSPTSPLSECTSPVVPHNPQALVSTSPAPPMAPPAPVINLQKRQSKSFHDTAFTYVFSDTTSVRTDNLSDGSDPDYEPSTSESVCSSEYSIKKRPKAVKRKIISNKCDCNAKELKVSEAQQVNEPNQPLVAGDENSVGFQSSSGSSLVHGIAFPDLNSSAFVDNIQDSTIIQPLESTAQWIDSHRQLGMLSSAIDYTSISIPPEVITVTTAVNTRLTSSGNIVYSTPGIITINPPGSSKVTSNNSRLTVSGNILYSTPGTMTIDPPGSSKSSTQVNCTSEQAAEDESHFKLPHLPVYRTKHPKNNNCPTRLLNGLQELLNSQPNINETICNVCKRCELLSKYKKVLIKLPLSKENEPDILESTTPDVYEFDSDDEGLKFLRRGRELVRNVLTTKRLPIWLCNLEMPLKKTMFQDEHKLGTLKRSIIFEKNDIMDSMVSKIITRLDYLNRCILEDKKELDAEKSRRRLRSAKRTGLPVSRKTPQKRKELSAPVRLRPAKRTGLPVSRKTPQKRKELSAPVRLRSAKRTGLPVSRKTPQKRKELSAPVHTTDTLDEIVDLVDDNNTPDDLNTGPEVPAEASTPPRPASANERHLVLCLTPLEEMVVPPATNAAHPVSNKETETIYIDDDDHAPVLHGGFVFEFLSDNEILCFENHRHIEIIDDDEEIPLEPTPIEDDPTLFEFRPTPEEFEDPIAYIGKIQKAASIYGICKIIPPEGFDVPCHLDDNCMFTTTNQYLCRLFQRWGVTSRELTIIQTYVATLANSRERDQFLKVPMFDGVELDLVKLYHTVLEHGGIEELLAHSEKWARIAEEMRLVSPRGKPDHKKLEKLYCKHVLPYESLSQFDRHSIQRQVDKMWSERSKSAIGRAQRPLQNQLRMLGRGRQFEYDDEMLLSEPELEGVRDIGQQLLDKVEECTGKGRTMNLATYRRIAGQIQAMRFSNGPAPTIGDLEEEYWDLLTLAQEHVSVLSACIDTSVDGLGHTSDPEGPGGKHPWNLKRLSENPRNVLSSLGKTLSVTVPTLCLNQLFSTNCWHMDPHKLAWMDYMHEGTTKVWYAVSAHDGDKFRRTMSVVSPTVAQRKGIWLASDTTMVPPSLLSARGVKINRVEQRPGEFIVVFPDAIASSFATGLTISESVYFESKSWLHRIDNIFRQLRLDCEPAMFSNTLLLFGMARDPAVSVEMLPRVHNSIKLLIQDELDTRREAKKFNCTITVDQTGRPDAAQTPISWPHQDECYVCRAPLILSRTVRYNDHRALMCLKHGLRCYSVAPREERGECGPPVTLLYDYSELEEINNMIENRLRRALGPNTKGSI